MGTQQQKGCENRCRKKFVGPLPFSPEIQGWIDRRDTLNWLKRYHTVRMLPNRGKRRKMKFKSLKRACRACKLPHPAQTNLEMIRDQLKICVESIKDLEPTAPQIRKDFLVSRLEHHIEEGTQQPNILKFASKNVDVTAYSRTFFRITIFRSDLG